MQNRPVSNGELNTLLLQAIRSTLVYYPETSDYLQDLYYTGCRSTEPLQINRWNIIGSVVELRTAKVDAKRKFPLHVLSPSLQNAINHQYHPYSGLTYDQLTLEFRKVLPLHPIYAGKRIADTYLFRYNRARLHFEEYNDLLITMEFFGWLSPAIAMNYIHQPLIYSPDNQI